MSGGERLDVKGSLFVSLGDDASKPNVKANKA